MTNQLVRISTNVGKATLVTPLKYVATQLVAIIAVASLDIIEIPSLNLVKTSTNVKLVSTLVCPVNVATTLRVATIAYALLAVVLATL